MDALFGNVQKKYLIGTTFIPANFNVAAAIVTLVVFFASLAALMACSLWAFLTSGFWFLLAMISYEDTISSKNHYKIKYR